MKLIKAILLAVIMVCFFAAQEKAWSEGVSDSTKQDNILVAGCLQRDDHMTVRFNKNCLGEADGYFNVPQKYTPSCRVISNDFLKQLRESGDSYLRMNAPLSDILSAVSSNDANKSDTIKIEINGVDKGYSPHRCDGTDIKLLLNDLLDRKDSKTLSYEEFIPYQEHEFKITGVGLDAEGMVFRNNDRYEIQRSSASDTEKKYDYYFKTDQQGTAIYRVKCYPWNNECHGQGTLALGGRHDYEVSFARSYADRLFSIMDAIPAYLEKLYIHDVEAKGD